MTTTTKKVLIWSAVAATIVLAVVIVKKMATKAANTVILPKKGTTVTTSIFLPDGFRQDSSGNIYSPNNTLVKTFDVSSNAYQLVGSNSWYINGIALKSYVPEAEIYQLWDGTWYDFEGNPD